MHKDAHLHISDCQVKIGLYSAARLTENSLHIIKQAFSLPVSLATKAISNVSLKQSGATHLDAKCMVCWLQTKTKPKSNTWKEDKLCKNKTVTERQHRTYSNLTPSDLTSVSRLNFSAQSYMPSWHLVSVSLFCHYSLWVWASSTVFWIFSCVRMFTFTKCPIAASYTLYQGWRQVVFTVLDDYFHDPSANLDPVKFI